MGTVKNSHKKSSKNHLKNKKQPSAFDSSDDDDARSNRDVKNKSKSSKTAISSSSHDRNDEKHSHASKPKPKLSACAKIKTEDSSSDTDSEPAGNKTAALATYLTKKNRSHPPKGARVTLLKWIGYIYQIPILKYLRVNYRLN